MTTFIVAGLFFVVFLLAFRHWAMLVETRIESLERRTKKLEDASIMLLEGRLKEISEDRQHIEMELAE